MLIEFLSISLAQCLNANGISLSVAKTEVIFRKKTNLTMI